MPSKYNKTATKSNYSRMSSFKEYENTEMENTKKFWFESPFTFICAGFMIIIHFLFWILSPTDILFNIPQQDVIQFGLNNILVAFDFFNNWYRLITSIFIHGNIFHLGGNILFFVIFSLRLEELEGTKKTAFIFLIAGLGGNILTVILFPTSNLWSLGASGAVNGVFMANLVTMRKSYDKGSLTMLAFLVIFGSFTLAGQNANFIAHIGGLLGGGLTMYYIEQYEKKHKRRMAHH